MPLASSFRDPNGFLFTEKGVLYRQINTAYQPHFDHLMASGLYQALTDQHLLVAHDICESSPDQNKNAYLIIKPRRIPFISYPYEWCFSQLRDAALLTLAIQKQALARGMTLKDATAFNVQFMEGKPLFIDTLSFEIYQEGKPWIAYKQFCEHFLAPLALMSHTDVRINLLSKVFIDGIPLDLACKLLPWHCRLSGALLIHLYIHAKSQQVFADRPTSSSRWNRPISKTSMMGLIESLESAVHIQSLPEKRSAWSDYYDNTNYSTAAAEAKKQVVAQIIDSTQPKTVWDLGANTGVFSRVAEDRKSFVVAYDLDPQAVEMNYRACVKESRKGILPLVLDLRNPSPALGWNHRERHSLLERGPVDLVLALALVHHLAIGNNLPFTMIAEFFAQAGRQLVIEFVPKQDSQTQRLLASREDIFGDYTRQNFEAAFSEYFILQEAISLPESERMLYRMKNKNKNL